MASNKASAVMAAIKTKLDTLVTSPFAICKRGLLNAGTEKNKPAIGIVCDRAVRQGGPVGERDWSLDVLIMIVADPGDSAVPRDDNVLDLMAEVDGALEALEATDGGAGAPLDDYRWDFWYDGANANQVRLVGAIASLTFKLEGPLKTS